jgi:hypothetical protein
VAERSVIPMTSAISHNRASGCSLM